MTSFLTSTAVKFYSHRLLAIFPTNIAKSSTHISSKICISVSEDLKKSSCGDIFPKLSHIYIGFYHLAKKNNKKQMMPVTYKIAQLTSTCSKSMCCEA